jgi:hypothetical protein
MFDLQALAFQADVTRVFSFKMGRDASSRVYPESGVAKGFHPGVAPRQQAGEHHRLRPDQQVPRQPAAVLPREAAVDSGRRRVAARQERHRLRIADGRRNVHNHKRCPLIVVGGAQGRLPGNLHVKAPAGTPMANAMLTVMHAVGLTDVQQFGDSTGELSLSGV